MKDGGISYEQTPRLRGLLLRSNLPSPQDLKRLASYLHQDALRQINDPEKVLCILAETREMLLAVAKTLEIYDLVLGGTDDNAR
jgi:hypothetical protein